jgi:hypothetical protein
MPTRTMMPSVAATYYGRAATGKNVLTVVATPPGTRRLPCIRDLRHGHACHWHQKRSVGFLKLKLHQSEWQGELIGPKLFEENAGGDDEDNRGDNVFHSLRDWMRCLLQLLQQLAVDLGLHRPPIETYSTGGFLVTARLRIRQRAIAAGEFVHGDFSPYRRLEETFRGRGSGLSRPITMADHEVANALLKLSIIAGPSIVWPEMRVDPFRCFFCHRLRFVPGIPTRHETNKISEHCRRIPDLLV